MIKLPVSISPHLHCGRNTRSIMLDVIIALLPAVIAATVIFGFRAILLVVVTVAACVTSEYLTRKIKKKNRYPLQFDCCCDRQLVSIESPSDIAVLDGCSRWCD